MVYLFKSESALYYECGYSCDNAILLTSPYFSYFITDGRYEIEARESVQNAEVVITRDLMAQAIKFLRYHRVRKLVFDPAEVNAKELLDIETKAPRVFLDSILGLAHKRRIIKSREEIALIKESQRRNKEAFANFAKYLFENKPTLSEKKLQYKAKDFLTQEGEFELSFEPIFALNGNGAKPHCLPSDKDALYLGDSVLFDAGIKYERYCSDMTRTAYFGDTFDFNKEQRFKDATKQKIYDTVRKAQEAAIKAVRPGIRANEIDKAARAVIAASGYGKFFVHSTGHGIGLDIHEYPVISARSETILEEGMVFSVEPGIYLGGEFGVRIEDLVAVTARGHEVL